MQSSLFFANEASCDVLSGAEGYSAADIFHMSKNFTAFTYDDLVLMPAHIHFGVNDVSIKSKLTRNITLNIPFVSSPMDTVTESNMAIHMALHGGIGILHSNMPPESQADQVRIVKKFKNGFITDLLCLSPTHNVGDVLRIKNTFGYSGIPITENGKMGGKLGGILSNRDFAFIEDPTIQIRDIMTPRDKLILLAVEGVSLEAANDILKKCKKGKLPVVNDKDEIIALIARRDLQKNIDFPLAMKDKQNKQRMGYTPPSHTVLSFPVTEPTMVILGYCLDVK